MANQKIAHIIVILIELLYTALMRKKNNKEVAGPATHQAPSFACDMREQYVGSIISPRT